MAFDMAQLQAQQNPAGNAAGRRLGALLNATPGQQAYPMQTAAPNPGDSGPMTPVTGNNNPTPPSGIPQNPGLQREAGQLGDRVPAGSIPGAIPISKVQFNVPNPLAGGTGDSGLDKYLLGDSAYQTQLSELMKQYDDYNAQKNLQASQTQADYDAKMKAMNTQTAQDQLNMRNAAAARGILYSGIYANQLGQYNDASQQQMTNLLGGLQNAKDTANLAYTQEVDQLEAAKQNAIQQAAARRAASLGTY